MPPIGGFITLCPFRALYTSLTYLLMLFRIPGTQTQVRLFERVNAVDEQYDIFDTGFQYDDGAIDSLVVGGSFATARSWAGDADNKAAKKAAKKAKKAAKAEAAAVQADVEADANLAALKTEVVEPMVTAPEDLVAA